MWGLTTVVGAFALALVVMSFTFKRPDDEVEFTDRDRRTLVSE